MTLVPERRVRVDQKKKDVFIHAVILSPEIIITWEALSLVLGAHWEMRLGPCLQEACIAEEGDVERVMGSVMTAWKEGHRMLWSGPNLAWGGLGRLS